MNMNSQPLLLARHAHICLADNHIVFLDLRQDQYFCLSRQESLNMRPMHAPKHESADREIPEQPIALEQVEKPVLKNLIERGLVVHDENTGKAAVFAHTELPSESLNLSVPTEPTTFTFQDAQRFFAASAIASSRLRWTSIERTIRAVARRKLAGPKSAAACGKRPIADLVAVFRCLRPFYPRQFLCLYDSLALVQFLARYDHFPQWVFGVKVEPFGAHCWVQDGGLVLNDAVDYVQRFKPIMTI